MLRLLMTRAASPSAQQQLLPALGSSLGACMQQGAARMGTQPFDASSPLSKEQVVAKALQAKAASGKTYAQIASEIGCTNLYTAALFYNQQQLKPDTAKALAKAVPSIDPKVLELMQKAPMRRFDPNVIQEPAVYRFYEAVMHNAEALKALINEEAGDGIMSAIDMYATVETVTGKQGEKRVVVSLSGKFLPFVEGKTADDVRNK